MTLQEFANKFCSKMFANTVLYANMEKRTYRKVTWPPMCSLYHRYILL